jgi:ABC-type branched-subunit amino acid transport system substrate-binding protein
LVAAAILASGLAACEKVNLFQGQPEAQGQAPAEALSLPLAPSLPVETPGLPAPPTLPTAPKVALLLPLTGPNAEIGKALLNAAEIALFDTADAQFELLPRDTGGTADGAAAATRAVLDEGAKLILGPFFAEEVSAAAPVAHAAGVNIVAFSTDERVAGNGVYLMGFLPRTQVLRVVSYAHERGLNRFAGVVPSSAYGETVAGLLRQAAALVGASIANIAVYDPAANNATQVVRQLANYEERHAALLAQRKALEAAGDDVSLQALQRLKNEDAIGDVDFDAIMLPEGGERLLALAPLLPFFDIDPARVRILGTGLWDDPSLGKEPELVGGWYAASDPKQRSGFEQRYATLFGTKPPRIATLGYDATALAALLARKEGGADFSAAALTNPNGFAGLDGIFRLRADGLDERGLAVLEVQRDGPKIVSPAPTSFATN